MVKKHREFWKKLGLIAFVGVILLLGFYRCPIKLVTGIDCPGCGMTRAFLSVLRLDFKAAFHYHPLFWLLGPEVLYVLLCFLGVPVEIKNKKIETAVGAVTVVLLLAVWVIRVFIL